MRAIKKTHFAFHSNNHFREYGGFLMDDYFVGSNTYGAVQRTCMLTMEAAMCSSMTR